MYLYLLSGNFEKMTLKSDVYICPWDAHGPFGHAPKQTKNFSSPRAMTCPLLPPCPPSPVSTTTTTRRRPKTMTTTKCHHHQVHHRTTQRQGSRHRRRALGTMFFIFFTNCTNFFFLDFCTSDNDGHTPAKTPYTDDDHRTTQRRQKGLETCLRLEPLVCFHFILLLH